MSAGKREYPLGAGTSSKLPTLDASECQYRRAEEAAAAFAMKSWLASSSVPAELGRELVRNDDEVEHALEARDREGDRSTDALTDE